MKENNQKTIKPLRVIPFLLVIAFAVSLTACKPKETITADVFIQKVEALGYQALDITDQYDEFPHVLKVIYGGNENVHIDFMEIDGTDNATGVFNSNKAKVESFKGNGASESSVSTGNYQKYTLKTSDTYYIVERVGTTIIYAYCDKSESESMDNIIKELGY